MSADVEVVVEPVVCRGPDGWLGFGDRLDEGFRDQVRRRVLRISRPAGLFNERGATWAGAFSGLARSIGRPSTRPARKPDEAVGSQ